MRFLLVICLVFSSLLVAFAAKNDWLKEAYRESHTAQAEPYALDAEAKDLFDTQIDVVGTIGNVIDGESDPIANADSIFVRFTRFLTRVAVVLAVPMLLFVAIKIFLSLGDPGKLKEAATQIAYVAAGLLLALLSVMIIYLVTSLTRSSVDSFRVGYVPYELVS